MTELGHRVTIAGSRDLSADVDVSEDGPPLSSVGIGAVAFLLQALEAVPVAEMAGIIARVVARQLAAPDGIVVTVGLQFQSGPAAVAHAAVGAALPVEDACFGHVDVVHEGEGLGVYFLRIDPLGTIPAHVHRKTDEWEYAVAGALALQGEAFPVGDAVRWPVEFPHRWDNRGATEALVLCIDRPRFDASDEVEVETTALQPCPFRFRPTPTPAHP